jgi:hypothetical protein
LGFNFTAIERAGEAKGYANMAFLAIGIRAFWIV